MGPQGAEALSSKGAMCTHSGDLWATGRQTLRACAPPGKTPGFQALVSHKTRGEMLWSLLKNCKAGAVLKDCEKDGGV